MRMLSTSFTKVSSPKQRFLHMKGENQHPVVVNFLFDHLLEDGIKNETLHKGCVQRPDLFTIII